jgi:hypothetical protein
MTTVDLQEFIEKLNTELEAHRPNWNSRIDAGAKLTSAALWANGHSVSLDLTEDHIEDGRKFDQIRMVILRDPREPLSEESRELLKTAIWRSVKKNAEIRWRDLEGRELTIEQVFGTIRSEFSNAAETDA